MRRRLFNLLPLLLTCLCGGCGQTRAQRAQAEARQPPRDVAPEVEPDDWPGSLGAGGTAPPGEGFAHFSGRVTLTAEAPRDEVRGIELLRVEEDGAAVIHVDETGETLSARPGQYYLGRYGGRYNVRTFGEHGLYLAESDPATQTAILVHHTAGPAPMSGDVPGGWR